MEICQSHYPSHQRKPCLRKCPFFMHCFIALLYFNTMPFLSISRIPILSLHKAASKYDVHKTFAFFYPLPRSVRKGPFVLKFVVFSTPPSLFPQNLFTICPQICGFFCPPPLLCGRDIIYGGPLPNYPNVAVLLLYGHQLVITSLTRIAAFITISVLPKDISSFVTSLTTIGGDTESVS